MSNYNKALLMGNLTRDPEVRFTPKGTAVAELSLAVNRRVKDGDNWKEETTFVDVTVWGSTAENCGKYLTKGRGVFVEGRLELDTWEDKQSGQKRSKLKVVGESVTFLPGREGKGDQPARKPQSQASHPASRDEPGFDDDDDNSDIPF